MTHKLWELLSDEHGTLTDDPPAGDPPAGDPPNDDPPAPNAAALQTELAAANGLLLQAARTANPAIPAAFIQGNNAQEIAASVEAAKGSVQAVLDANKGGEPPAGTPPPPKPHGSAAAPPRPEGPPAAPEGTRGVRRIAHALNHPGEGTTKPTE